MSRREIERLLRKGALIPEFPGVYRVGHAAPSIKARYMAAVKACGTGATLSGLAAAYLHGLVKRPPSLPQVTTLTERRVKGIEIMRVRKPVDRRDVGKVEDIPVTKVPRTLVDIAASLTEDELARACHEAGVKYRTTPLHVKQALSRKPNAKGAKSLRAVMEGHVPVSLSALERMFVQRLDESRLRHPDDMNKPAGSKRIDCRWRAERLTVELDSYRFHNSRYSWEQDRRREREAYARGDQFRRYTSGDVFEEPGPMLAELRELLR